MSARKNNHSNKHQQYTIIDLSTPPEFEESRAAAINDNGQIIGSMGHSWEDQELHAVLWDEDKLVDLGALRARAINNSGQIVGTHYSEDLTKTYAFLYSNGVTNWLFPDNTDASAARDINDNGQVVGRIRHWQSRKHGSKRRMTRQDAFVWDKNGIHPLEVPSGCKPGSAQAINTRGDIVGDVGTSDPSDEHAVLWRQGQVHLLQTSPGFNRSRAVAINNVGQVLIRALRWQTEIIEEIVRKTEAGQTPEEIAQAYPEEEPVIEQQSFVWEDSEVRVIDGLADSINDHGQVVGWSGCSLMDNPRANEPVSAFLWQNGDMIDLADLLPSDAGWRLIRANGINNRGQIVGYGEHSGKTRAFLLTPEAISNP